MGICRVTADEIEKHMPCAMLTLGAQDKIETVDLKGGSVECVDVKAHKGFERIADLNEPADLGSYDLVVDCGTIEHCPNIFQAVKNASGAVKVGGAILHHSPVTMVNHGYFNVSPVFFRDYYELNGWQIERAELMDEGDNVVAADGDLYGGVKAERNMLVLVVARRLDGSTVGRYPLQKEYR
jgi:hypothetical protein